MLQRFKDKEQRFRYNNGVYSHNDRKFLAPTQAKNKKPALQILQNQPLQRLISRDTFRILE